MAKILKFDQEAREKLLKGINTLANAVATTLGPKGRNAAIDRKWGVPLVVHDGVTVAKEIDLEDPFENMGAQILKEAASKTNDLAGDGTTTATVLAQAICNEAIKQINSGVNPQELKTEIEESLKVVLKDLEKLVKPISTDEEAEQVATISSANPVLGKLVAEAIKKVGTTGVVTVEEGQGFETTVDYKEGMEFDKGYLSPYFVTDTDKMEANLENPYILLTDASISKSADLIPFLEKFVEVSKNLVIIASNIEGEALSFLLLNKMRGSFNPLVIQAPGFGERKKEMLEDIAVLTGGTVISVDTGMKLDSVDIEKDLGRSKRVISTKDSSIIVDGKGTSEALKDRISVIKSQLERVTADFDKEKLQERLAKLTGGVAVISVGAMTEVEMKEKKERVIDAVAATKAAVEEGIVAGGEITLWNLSKGKGILARALKAPFKKLLDNSGLEYAETMTKLTGTQYPAGIDVMDGEVKDLIKSGIIDPVKVTRSALQNAVSVAIMVMTTDVLITDLSEPKE